MMLQLERRVIVWNQVMETSNWKLIQISASEFPFFDKYNKINLDATVSLVIQIDKLIYLDEVYQYDMYSFFYKLLSIKNKD
jgi:hypothetical protein